MLIPVNVIWSKLVCRIVGHAVSDRDEDFVFSSDVGYIFTLCPRCLETIELERIDDEEYWVYSE